MSAYDNTSSVPLDWCPVHGRGARVQRSSGEPIRGSTVQPLTWWECPRCIAAVAEPKATPKEPAAPTAATLLSREELEALNATFSHPIVQRLLATARAGIEAREERDSLAMKLDAMTTERDDYHDALRTVQDNISQAGTKLAETRADADRLDWLEANCEVQTHRPLLQWPNMNGNTLREDIDSARTDASR